MNLNVLIKSLIEETPIITDGAWGTMLQAQGLPVGEMPDAWNLEQPDKVEQVARAYVEAGSRIILTNTFGSSRCNLERYGLADRCVEINRAGAMISKRAAGNRAYVFASIGPSGKMLAMGEVSESDLEASFSEQAEALAEGGADALVIETMSDLTEARIAIQAAKKTGLPVAGCMVFDTGKNKDRTMMGTTPEQAVEALTETGVDIIGSNCGNGIEGFIALCRRMRACTPLPLWMKANAGLPQLQGDLITYNTTPDEFASHFSALQSAGANFIGGCCGTSPDFIRALAQQREQSFGKETK